MNVRPIAITMVALILVGSPPSRAAAGLMRLGFEATVTTVEEGIEGPVRAGDALRGAFTVLDDRSWETGGVLNSVSWEVRNFSIAGDGWSVDVPGRAGALYTRDDYMGALGMPLAEPPGPQYLVIGTTQLVEPAAGDGDGLASDASIPVTGDGPFGYAYLVDADGNIIGVLTDFGDIAKFDIVSNGLIVPMPVVSFGFEVTGDPTGLPALCPDLAAMWPELRAVGSIGYQRFLQSTGLGPQIRFEVTSFYAIPEPASAGLALAAVAGGLLAFGRGRRGRPSAASGKLKGGLVRSASILSLAACVAALAPQTVGARTLRYEFEARFTEVAATVENPFDVGETFRGNFLVEDSVTWSEDNALILIDSWAVSSAKIQGESWSLSFGASSGTATAWQGITQSHSLLNFPPTFRVDLGDVAIRQEAPAGEPVVGNVIEESTISLYQGPGSLVEITFPHAPVQISHATVTHQNLAALVDAYGMTIYANLDVKSPTHAFADINDNRLFDEGEPLVYQMAVPSKEIYSEVVWAPLIQFLFYDGWEFSEQREVPPSPSTQHTSDLVGIGSGRFSVPDPTGRINQSLSLARFEILSLANIPEPASMGLMVLAIFGGILARRRRRAQ